MSWIQILIVAVVAYGLYVWWSSREHFTVPSGVWIALAILVPVGILYLVFQVSRP